MPCDLKIWDSAAKSKTAILCDEENAAKIVADEHAGKATGQYSDVAGKSASFDWTKCRLVKFARRQ
jgi:hypothetical protein